MTDNIEINPDQSRKSKLPVVALAILGVILAGYCIFGILVLLKPNQPSFVEKYFPSPTVTLTPAQTPTPAGNSTLASTVTQGAQNIQTLATNSASQWPILFSDAFDTDHNNWSLGGVSNDNYDYALEIKAGKYSWSVTSKKDVFISTSPSAIPVTDFHLSAELKLVKGSYKPSYGLVFRDNPNGDIYFFGIYGEGFLVDIYYNQTWSTIIDYTKSSAILPQETNRLTVIAEGSHFAFFINDQFVGEMTDDRIREGSTGIGLAFYQGGLQNTFEIDNYILRAQNK